MKAANNTVKGTRSVLGQTTQDKAEVVCYSTYHSYIQTLDDLCLLWTYKNEIVF